MCLPAAWRSLRRAAAQFPNTSPLSHPTTNTPPGKLSSTSKSTVEDRDVTTMGEPFTLSHKLRYCFPTVVDDIMSVLGQSYLAHYYTTRLDVGTAYLSLAIVLCGLMRALTQLLVGYLSDRTRSRWGRRAPWIVVWTPVLAASVFALLYPPSGLRGGPAAAYFTVTYATFNFASGAIEVVYDAVGAELAATNEAKRSLFAYKSLFGVSGLLTVSLMTAFLDESDGMHLLGFVVAVVAMVAFLNLAKLSVDCTPQRREVHLPLVPGLRAALETREFACIVGVLLTNGLVSEVTSTFLFLFSCSSRWHLDSDEAQSTLAPMLGLYVVGAYSAVPLGRRAMVLRGKIWTLNLSFALYAAYGVLGYLATFAPSPWWMAGPAMLLGLGAQLFTYCVSILTNDVIALDELRTGRCRASTYHSALDLPSEFSSVLGQAVPLMAMAALGFDADRQDDDDLEQPEGVQAFLAMYTTLLAPVCALAGWAFFRGYGLTEAKVMEVLTGLEQLRAGQSAVDPLTGETILPPDEGEDDVEHAKPLTTLQGDADASRVYYFSPAELAHMQSTRSVVPRYVATVLLWTSYTAVLTVRGVQLLRDRRVDPCMVVSALWALFVCMLAFEVLRWRGVQWFMSLTPQEFDVAVGGRAAASSGFVWREVATHVVAAAGVCVVWVWTG